jgi:competence CoiA-like predicted nuclease
MGQRGKETEVSEQATCKVCGLTARTKDELEVHIHHAHGTANSDKVSSEQKVDPFP